jgi:GTP-binding protein Era
VLVLVVEAPRDGHVPKPFEPDMVVATELPELPTVLAINKVDWLKDKSRLLPLLAAFAERHDFAATVPISAKRTNGTDRLLQEVCALLPEQPFLFEEDTLSDQPVRFFVAEFVREQILKQTRQEVPHGVAVIVERFDESGKMPHIEVAVHVAREAHKKILVGTHGQMLKSIGMAARARVEQMLSRRVHLQLWVRATPGWMDDPARLRELGYS